MYWYTSSSDSKSSGGEWHRFVDPLSLSHFADLSNCSALLFFFFFGLFYIFFSSPFFRSFAVRSRMNIIDRVLFFSSLFFFSAFVFIPFSFYNIIHGCTCTIRCILRCYISITPILFVTSSRDIYIIILQDKALHDDRFKRARNVCPTFLPNFI